MDLLKSSLNSTFSGRWVKEFYSDFHIIDRATVTEDTHSDKNGWHPHIHMLAFCEYKPNASLMKTEVSERFSHFVNKKGGYSSLIHGVDVRTSKSDISGYLSKWTIPTELTQLQAKAGKGESLTVWEIAQLAGNGNRKYQKLWLEYVNATFRKKLFTWSRGARARLGLDDAEKILEERLADEKAEHIISLTIEEWHFIQDKKLIGLVYYLAMKWGAKSINEMMLDIRGIPLENYRGA